MKILLCTGDSHTQGQGQQKFSDPFPEKPIKSYDLVNGTGLGFRRLYDSNCYVNLIRHFLYDSGIFKETAYPVPVVCVGNITVGGTGKTPFTEMIIRHMQDKHRIAVLSRGYKRESKGFVLATENSTHREIGDEPLQIKKNQ